MKHFWLLLLVIGIGFQGKAQTKNNALPAPMYKMLRDSTTSIDVVFMIGNNGSLSMDGKNVQIFNTFFEDSGTAKIDIPQAASIMWQINGREFLSGFLYIGDTEGCVVFNKDNREYVNRVSPAGVSFFKGQLK